MGAARPTKLVLNERIKLLATALNGVAIAAIVAGFVTPLAAVSLGIETPAERSLSVTVLASLAWLVGGVGLHVLASLVLGGLRE